MNSGNKKVSDMEGGANTKNAKNLRTALILASVAVAFFVGIIIKQVWFR